jgi:hypothetical protein
MAAANCKEVQDPEREDPRPSSSSLSPLLYRYHLYHPPLLRLPGCRALLATNAQPIDLLSKTATTSAAGAFGLLFLTLGILMFPSIGALAAASRCTLAFARDSATPG